MKRKTSTRCSFRRIVAFLSMFALIITSMPNVFGVVGKASSNVPYEQKKSLQPLGNIYSIKTLLEWTPESDPDARYNKATIPMQDRFQGPVVNPKANADAKVMNIALTNTDCDNAPSQGSDSFDAYSFSYWQYINSYVYWGGSSRGIFAIPTPDIVDLAHKNGVPVVATIGFPWGSGAGYVEQVREFIQKDEKGNFPVADKMIEIAEFYGFDGYFFNQESYGCGQEDADKMVEMISYIKNKRPKMLISWYDSMSNTGNVSYQNALNSRNDRFFQVGDQRVVDEFFLNYNWYSSIIDTSVETAKSHNRSPFDVYAGLDVQQNGYNTRFNHKDLVDENGKLKVSLGMYCPNSMFSMAKDAVDFYNQDQMFWVGPSKDPSKSVDDSKNWTGIARFIADRSPITKIPFVTNFNAGHGKKYYIDGSLSRTKEWNNRALQEYLPTWRWIIDSNGSKLQPEFDFEDAYNGGTSLKIKGKLESANPNHIKLYSTNLKIEKDTTKLSITYKTPLDDANMQVGLCFGDTYDEENFVFFDVEKSAPNTWTTSNISLASHIGKTISAISLKFKSDADIENYDINIGRIAVVDGAESTKLTSPASVTLDEIMYKNASKAEARIYWDKVDSNKISFYEIYRVKEDGTKEFIGATPNNAYYIPSLARYEGEDVMKLEVVPVDKNYTRGEGKLLNIKWGIPENATEIPDETVPENFALNKPTKTSRSNDSEPGFKAVDGTSANNSKWCATNAMSGWLEVDLGEPKTVQRWRVEHAEAGGEDKTMNTVDFSLQYSEDGGKTFKDIDIVKGNDLAITDRALAVPVKSQFFRLNITNSGRSPWGAIRIYEFQLYEKPAVHKTEPVLMQFVTAKNNAGANDEVILTNVPEGYTVNLYKAIDSKEALATKKAEKDDKGIVKFTGIDLGKEAGRIYYAVKSEDKDESLRFSVPYSAEDWEAAPAANKLELKEYNLIESASTYGSLLVKDLKEGDVVYLYNSMEDEFPAKKSVPVLEGQTTTLLERIKLNSEGGKLILELHREGMKPSERYEVKYDGNKAIVKKAIRVLPTEVVTEIGQTPKLPEKVTVEYSDETNKEISVVWDDIEPSKYANAGTFEVEGTVEGTDIRAKAIITVNEKVVIIPSIDVINIDTEAGFAPKLPDSVTIKYSNGTTSEAQVSWDKIEPTKYEKAGIFEVEGIVEGIDIKAKAIVNVTKKAELEIERLAGDNRVETAIKTSQRGWDKSESVILANGYDFPDALAGVSYAYGHDAPILLTAKDKIDSKTIDEIKRLDAKTIHILGGVQAVSKDIEENLKKQGYEVRRIAGLDRYDTAVKVGKEVIAETKVDTVFIAYGLDFPDALSASTYAAEKGLPILFTGTKKLNEYTAKALKDWGIKKAYILGGNKVISSNVDSELKKLGITTERFDGVDRYDTALKIAEKFGNGVDSLTIVSGLDFPDALAGSVFGAKENAPIMLYNKKLATKKLENYIKESAKYKLYIVGGEKVVPQSDIETIIK